MKRIPFRRVLRIALLAVAVVFGLAWGIGEIAYPRTNPPGRHTPPILSAGSDEILRRACFDCHSNESIHPWYTHLPVLNLLIADHIREGREELNFSDWDSMGAEARGEALEESLETIQEGEMPVVGYTLLHPDALLSEADLATLQADASPFLPTEGGEGGGHGNREDREKHERDEEGGEHDKDNDRD